MTAIHHWLDSPWTHGDQIWAVSGLFLLWLVTRKKKETK